ncbi:MAG: oxygenase MpaB family protein [Pseudomonadota bacterium]|nr:oxygenase MpaB family protein [Pseudomonadota bacterium]
MGSLNIAKRYWMFRQPAVRRQIEQLDAQQDCQHIAALLATYEYPYEFQHALELALLYTYASPKVSRLLDRTGEFAKHGQKRYDDTRILIGLLLESGWDGDFGRQALQRINQTHGHYRIHQDEFLFVLWTFIDFPIQWTLRYSQRAMTAHEQTAWFNFWIGIGQRMGLQDLPLDQAAFDEWQQQYQLREFYYDPANQRVTRATTHIIENMLPRPLRPVVNWMVSGLMNAEFLYAVGYPQPTSAQRWLCHGLLKAYSHVNIPLFWMSYPVLVSRANDPYAKQQLKAIHQIQPMHLAKRSR